MDRGFAETYCAWFEALPPEVARELALSLMQLAPGGLLEGHILTSDPADGFVPRVRRLATNAMRDAGAALTVAALTDFVFYERGDPDEWRRNEALLGLLGEAQGALYGDDDREGQEIAEWIEQNRLRYPLRARQWLKAHESWQSIRAGALSLAAIHGGAIPQRDKT